MNKLITRLFFFFLREPGIKVIHLRRCRDFIIISLVSSKLSEAADERGEREKMRLDSLSCTFKGTNEKRRRADEQPVVPLRLPPPTPANKALDGWMEILRRFFYAPLKYLQNVFAFSWGVFFFFFGRIDTDGKMWWENFFFAYTCQQGHMTRSLQVWMANSAKTEEQTNYCCKAIEDKQSSNHVRQQTAAPNAKVLYLEISSRQTRFHHNYG